MRSLHAVTHMEEYSRIESELIAAVTNLSTQDADGGLAAAAAAGGGGGGGGGGVGIPRRLNSGQTSDSLLPLGLNYPLIPMQVAASQIQRELADARGRLRRQKDEEHDRERARLNQRLERLEDEVATARAERQGAEQNARREEQQREARAERRRREEQERRAREERRRQEEEAARKLRADQEAQTTQLLARANREDGAREFGERGDMRMCGRCKAGPIINHACSDLAAHNDAATTYKGQTVAAHRGGRPNDCPNCGWHHDDWHRWPKWDGVFGPH